MPHAPQLLLLIRWTRRTFSIHGRVQASQAALLTLHLPSAWRVWAGRGCRKAPTSQPCAHSHRRPLARRASPRTAPQSWMLPHCHCHPPAACALSRGYISGLAAALRACLESYDRRLGSWQHTLVSDIQASSTCHRVRATSQRMQIALSPCLQWETMQLLDGQICSCAGNTCNTSPVSTHSCMYTK